MAQQLASISNEFAEVIERASSSVVAVHGGRRTTSSGILLRPGIIATAEHTIKIDEDITITDARGETVPVTLAGRDPGTDIAILKSENLQGTVFNPAGVAHPRVGDWTFVVGRSPNSGPNAALGIISAVSGPWRTWRGGQLDAYIRLGAEIFSGSSGGAVIDWQGRLIGIATSALSRVAGLAIPASTVDRVAEILLKEGSVPRPYLGVGLRPVSVPGAYRQKLNVENDSGLIVLSLDDNEAAEKGGILIGDILLQIDGSDIEEMENLQSHIGQEKIGKPVTVKLIRGAELREVSIVIGRRK
jgi:S1-C subfamily serine protease